MGNRSKIYSVGRGWRYLNDDGNESPMRWYHHVAEKVADWWSSRGWRRRQAEFERTGTRYYGDGGTIHGTKHLHIETFRGTVVAVWFRCQPLPFEQAEVDGPRATDMQRMYGNPKEGKPAGDNGAELHGVEIRDPVL